MSRIFLLLVLVLLTNCQILPSDNLYQLLDVEGRPITLSNSVECYRECRQNDAPKLCYYRFIAENFMSVGEGCDLCTPNKTNPFLNNCQCVLGDGFEHSLLTINRQIPGSTIQVCKHDRVVIDVSNKIQGQDLSIHWHGVLQKGTQYYDGVPFVTQCPIMEGNTFRYQWVAEQPGTHFYHSHSGLQEMNGIYGSIIIREPIKEDVHGFRYDTDLSSHVLIISDWMYELPDEHFPGHRFNLTAQIPRTFLINGKGLPNGEPIGSAILESFTVIQGLKHRFRMINACGSVCPVVITIEKHRLQLIATDSAAVDPIMVDSIVSFTGERYDFVLTADQSPGVYWIQLRGLGECAETEILQIAQLNYKNNRDLTRSNRPYFSNPLPAGVILNPFDNACDDTHPEFICIDALNSLKPVNRKLLKNKPDYKIFLSFLFREFNVSEMYWDNLYEHYLVAQGNATVHSLINRINFVSPPSPMLSQFNDIPSDMICAFADPKKCRGGCSCSHLLEFPKNSVVEIIVVDEAQVPALSHPFHLHGHEFYVLNMKVPRQFPNGTLDVPYLINLDRKGRLARNLHSPPAKDTLAVPRSGFIVVRFHATNPGFWLLHCHFQFHIVIGMNLVIRVGEEEDVPPVPKNFPRCGDFTPPMFPEIYSLRQVRTNNKY